MRLCWHLCDSGLHTPQVTPQGQVGAEAEGLTGAQSSTRHLAATHPGLHFHTPEHPHGTLPVSTSANTWDHAGSDKQGVTWGRRR